MLRFPLGRDPSGRTAIRSPLAHVEATDVSSLSDRRRHRHPDPWYEAQPSRWTDFILPLSFSAIFLLITVFAVFNGIPIGESVLWEDSSMPTPDKDH
jgi:hypothetical protein